MNKNGDICIGMIGAGRATELHMNAVSRVGHGVYAKGIAARRIEQVEMMKERYGFEYATLSYSDLFDDDEIDIIDICTPPYLHEQMILEALRSGKNVICEKPLCGFFGNGDETEPIADIVSKAKMYQDVLCSLERIRVAVENSDKLFMYAENFVYAPAIRKAAEIIKKKKSKILFAKGEESLKGSSSSVAGEWSKTGGGTFSRTGSHPLSAILWLKSIEAAARKENIYVESVWGDMAQITPNLSEYEHRHIAAKPIDVEDFGIAVITFSDGTKASITATDTLLGGSKNYVELYCNDAAINCKLTMTDMMDTYFLDEEGLDDVYISEMLPSRLGWNHPFVEDETIRGYTDEMRDFIESVRYNRKPLSGFSLAYETAKITYAAYKSAEIGQAIIFEK